MKYLKKIGILLALSGILMGMSVQLVSAQDDYRNDRRMQSRHRHNSYWRNNRGRRHHRRHHYYNNGYIRRDNQ